MEKLKKGRKYVRAAFTKVKNEAEENLAMEPKDLTVLRLNHEKLRRLTQEMKELDEKILDTILDNGSEEEYTTERDGIEDYRDGWNRIDLTLQQIFDTVNQSESSHKSLKKATKLPKIELSKFDGNVMGWLKFWTQFEKVDADDDLHDSDKFQYLIQCMLPGTRPRELVESYPLTAQNYRKAVTALKERYGRKDLQIEIYVRELHKLALANASGKERPVLGKMYDTLEAHLRALESLGVTSDCFAAMLYPIIESSLPEEILRAFQRSAMLCLETTYSHEERLKGLMLFLKNEVEAEERITLARDAMKRTSEEKSYGRPTMKPQKTLNKVPSAAGLFVGQAARCVFCEKQHSSSDCVSAQSMSLEKRRETLRSKNACFLCLKPGHRAKMCKAFLKCIFCSKRHAVLMCPDISNRPEQSSDREATSSDSVYATHFNTNLECTNDVLLQTLQLFIKTDSGEVVRVRALLDPGSQRSYLLQSTARELNLNPHNSQNLRHVLFGGKEENLSHVEYSISLTDGKSCTLENVNVLDQKQICGVIPRMPKGSWLKELKGKNIWVPDIGYGYPQIQLLIGSDYYGRFLTGKKYDLSNGLTALETCFGWVLSGRRSDADCSSSGVVTTMYISERNVSDLWSLETLGIQDPIEVKTSSERDNEIMAFFNETVKRKPDGRYSVKLPWVEDCKLIPDNKELALKRLENTSRRLRQTEMFEKYDEIFKAWESEGFIETVKEEEPDKRCHYLPHRAVVKPESTTTPIRPVFDASSKSQGLPSLNDCLERGPNLLKFIPSIILRFRKGKIGFISDIRKAFQMIEVDSEDRDFLRFLWWEDAAAHKLKIFRHKRVVFGVKASPFLLAAVIERHLKSVNEEEKSTAEFLDKSYYVDNCVASLDSFEEYEVFKVMATRIMADAKMELRQWECTCDGEKNNLRANEENCHEEDSDEKWRSTVLGLSWARNSDTLSCKVEFSDVPSRVTKRSVLSILSKVYDPIGFTAPVTIKFKLLMQELWQKKLAWDQELSETDREKVKTMHEDIRRLSEIKIPRHIAGNLPQIANRQIHCFCDASKNIFAAVVYLRVEEDGKCSVKLLQAKARVAPLKRPTIPRLELMGCLIAARLTQSVKEALEYEDVSTFYWTDSTTALAWIKRDENWNVFVSNRVKEIRSLSAVESWKFVPGQNNPADLISRGCSVDKLLTLRWWEGPLWLRDSIQEWPSSKEEIAEDDTLVDSERKKNVSTAVATECVQSDNSLFPFSKYLKNIRVIAWILRFANKCRGLSQQRNQLTIDEMNTAERFVFRKIQQESFSKKNDLITGICVQKDDEGLLRIKTKLLNRNDLPCFKKPVILPNKHRLVDQMIMEEHLRSGHGGVQMLMSKLREKVWILQTRRACQRVLRTCRNCIRHTSKPYEVDPATLPENRVKEAEAFEVTGVDLAGPLFLRNGTKAWIVLYTCAVFRCVWLDYVLSVSTEAFIDSLQRFISLCGRPKTIYSDNGTNFVGANNIFKKFAWKKIQESCSIRRIKWIFNPPTAAWWGGWWERLIRSVKDLLKRMIGNARVDCEQLRTSLATVQAAINDRPLTYVTEDQNDLIPLTPSMFLRPLKMIEFPEFFSGQNSAALRDCFQRQKTLQHELKSRFRNEYLAQLIQRSKEKKLTNVNINDIVLIGSDAKKRIEWPLGRVIELLPGKDGKVRVCRVRTSYGTLLRPVRVLYPLEIRDSDNLAFQKRGITGQQPMTDRETRTGETVEDDRTSRGRTVKRPDRFVVA